MMSDEYNCMVYIIRQGDTLYSISRRYNVPLALLLKANPFVDIYNLRVDDELCIPVMGEPAQDKMVDYAVQDGDTLQSITMKNGIEVEDILLNNSLDNIHLMPGTTLRIPEVTGDIGEM